MEKVKEFLKIIPNQNYGNGNGDGNGGGNGDGGGGNGDGDGDGDGYGDGDGDGNGNGNGGGYGNGNGDGYGYGYGDGYGDGNGDGNGYGGGYGNGNGIKSFNNQTLHTIDKVQTIITSIKNNIAKGFILQSDFTLTPCYVVKGENQFAHGTTIKEAVEALQTKLLQTLSVEERIIKFKEYFNSNIKKYKALDFYDWHTRLTGSCDLGKQSFCKDKNINIKKDKFTVLEFIALTKNSYASNIILQLEKEYK